AVVEAADGAVARAVDDHVHGLAGVALGQPLGRVVAVADVLGRVVDVHAVRDVAADHDLAVRGVGLVAAVGQPQRLGRLGQVVVVRRLVVDDRDGAGGAGAESILHGDVDESARADRDVLGGLVGGAPDLVQRAGVAAKQGADGAVRRHAGGVGGLIDVTGAHRPAAPAGGRAAAGAGQARGAARPAGRPRATGARRATR